MMPWLVQIMDRADSGLLDSSIFFLTKLLKESYIGIIFNRLSVQFCLIHFIIKEEFRCIMLAEGIITEENILSGQVAEHGIRPVQHPGFDEYKLFFAQA